MRPYKPAIPATLQDSLMARLDRLGAAKEIAQLERRWDENSPMSYSRLSPRLNEDTLQQGLRQLVEAELVYQSGLPPRRAISSSMH